MTALLFQELHQSDRHLYFKDGVDIAQAEDHVAERFALCWNALRRVSSADLKRAQGDGIAWVTAKEAEFVERRPEFFAVLQNVADRLKVLPNPYLKDFADKIDELLLLQ